MRAVAPLLAPAACLLAASLALHGCRGEDHVCTAIACGPVLVARLNLSSPLPPDAAVTTCRGDVCADAALPSTPAAPGSAVTLTFSGPGAADVSARLSTRSDGSLQLEVDWSAYATSSPPLAIGDTFSVTVAQGGGAPFTGVTGTVSEITSSRPNGPDCPPFCLSGGAIGDAP